jgi:hypothetical protein
MAHPRRYTIGDCERMRWVISADQMTALRTLLTGKLDEHRRAIAEMDRTDGWKGYNELITAAFVNVVDQRFGARYTVTDIVEYVAEVRTRLRDPDRGINPNVAERLIRKALGEGTLRGIDKKTLLHTEGVLLVALIVDEQLDDAALDTFLAEARATADSFLTNRERAT